MANRTKQDKAKQSKWGPLPSEGTRLCDKELERRARVIKGENLLSPHRNLNDDELTRRERVRRYALPVARCLLNCQHSIQYAGAYDDEEGLVCVDEEMVVVGDG